MSTPRPTPETDAATFDIPHHGADGTGSRVAVVHYQVARRLECERDEAREALSGRTMSCLQCNEAAKQIEAMRVAINTIHAEADAYADGAPDASAHDKFCNEIVAKLKPFIKP